MWRSTGQEPVLSPRTPAQTRRPAEPWPEKKVVLARAAKAGPASVGEARGQSGPSEEMNMVSWRHWEQDKRHAQTSKTKVF